MRWSLLLVVVILITLCGCTSGKHGSTIDQNTSVPKGDPNFPALSHYWVIDPAKVLSSSTIEKADSVCQSLKSDGIAEVVVVVINGVKHPQDWTTHYGRWLALGKKGLSTHGGNNGIVWLIRPDADEKLTVSVGRGLPKFTSSDYRRIIGKVIDFLNFGNLDRGVEVLVQETNNELRAKYGKEYSNGRK